MSKTLIHCPSPARSRPTRGPRTYAENETQTDPVETETKNSETATSSSELVRNLPRGLTCFICDCPFLTSDPMPKYAAACGHTFCENCLDQFGRRCPECKQRQAALRLFL